MATIHSTNFDSETAGVLPAGWTEKKGTWRVGTSRPVSGAQSFGPTTDADTDVVIYTGATARADMQVDTSQLIATTAGYFSAISHILRSDAAANNHYAVLFSSITAGAFTIFLFKKVGGAYSSVSNQPVTQTSTAGDILRIRTKIIGNTITAYTSRNGGAYIQVATFTDASITAAGHPGLYYSKNQVTMMAVDDFVYGDGAAPAASTVTVTSMPTAGTVGVASAPFTLATDAAFTGTLTVTPGDGGQSGVFSPATATVTNGVLSTAMTYTAASAGVKVLSFTNDGSLANPGTTNFTAAATDTTAPMIVSAQVANATPSIITLTFDEAISASSTPAIGTLTAALGRTVTAVGVPSGVTVPVTVSTAYTSSDTGITLAYVKPAANPRWQDAAGNAVADFSTAVTNNVAAGPINALTSGTGNVLFSPYNWDIQASTAKTINAGAYFKTVFSGTACTLNFDMTGILAPLPQISYRVDRFGPWISVPIAASVVLTIPADTAGYANKPGHLLEVIVKSMTETQPRWSTQATAVKLTGIIVDNGKAITAPPALPLKSIFFGDSITEGVRTVNSTATFDVDRNDAGQCWSLEVGRILGAEVGNVGFGATGLVQAGAGGVPNLQNTYNLLYAGVSRSFTPSPDFIVLMEGTNDGGVNTTSAVTTVLNGLLAATTAKIVILRPFNGAGQGPYLQAGIAACTNPSRCLYVSTAGFFTSANSADTLHPYGVENITHIAPSVANAIRTFVTGAVSPPVLTNRTATITFGTEVNRTGAMVALYDEPTPNLFTVVRYQTALETIDGSGVMTATYGSTLASGAAGGFVIQFADKTSVNGQMVVA